MSLDVHSMDAYDYALLFKLSPKTVFRLAKKGAIPCYRHGTAVRFDPRVIARRLREGGAA